MTVRDFDVIFAGGGLSATLAAYRLRQLRPDLRLLVVEAGERLGGNHTWSFHDGDIDAAARSWVAPFIAHSWNEQQVRFPKYVRRLASGYNTIFSETLHEAALPALAGCVRFSARVRHVAPDHVVLEGGDVLRAACVIDARGAGPLDGLALGYQKFVGLVVRVEEPHGQPYPIIMDATVAQRDGYRFVYTLPFAPDRMLIEDTYYSDTPIIDGPKLGERCVEYARRRGWRIAEILREERGVLPVVLAGDAEGLLQSSARGVPQIGLNAGLFHHTTSYSFPFAVKCATAIAAVDALDSETLDAMMRDWMRRHWQNQRFFRRLNRMLFWAARPDQRYRILERFYELPEPLIERFYGSGLSFADQARILMGWPPVPIGRALRVIGESRINPISHSSSSTR